MLTARSILWCGLVWGLLGPVSAPAADLLVAFPADLPPWTLTAEDRGIGPDLLRAALARSGDTLRTKYVSLARLALVMDEPGVDAVALVEGRKTGTALYYSDSLARFDTVLVSLAQREFRIERLDALFDRAVIGFPDAAELIGAVAVLRERNSRYSEQQRQQEQVAALFQGRADVILLDRSVFAFWRARLDRSDPRSLPYTTLRCDTTQALAFHDVQAVLGIKAQRAVRVAFRDASLRDRFNIGLSQLRASGEYPRIVAGYTEAPAPP